jgi:hypothetical protein
MYDLAALGKVDYEGDYLVLTVEEEAREYWFEGAGNQQWRLSHTWKLAWLREDG